jgi:NTE family protein
MESGDGKPVVGLALGSGSARGWAHIGVIQALEALGIRPQVVAGTSIGALVGAVYVSGQLAPFANWVENLSVREVFGLLDFSLSGGMVKGDKLFALFEEKLHNPGIRDLDQRFMAVTTEMHSGRELWISRGSVLQAARASCALPGVFSPVWYEGRWVLDGGLVNPVPVSLCRAMGAEVVIAVNLNGQLINSQSAHARRDVRASQPEADEERSIWQKLGDYFSSAPDQPPGFFDVVSSSINIMQDRITRSRMAGDPAEVVLTPLLDDFALMDFHRAGEAMEEGRRMVERHREEILGWL